MNDLVKIKVLIPSIKLNIRYSTTDNFTGKKLYPKPHAYLIDSAANDLKKAQYELGLKGYGIVIWDAFRPLSVTQKLWDYTIEKNNSYVADPRTGSIHNRGCAVDLTLQELSTGFNVDMPTGFDDFTTSASPLSVDRTYVQRMNRDLLISVMQHSNFEVDKHEWWHFNWYRWNEYPILNTDLATL